MKIAMSEKEIKALKNMGLRFIPCMDEDWALTAQTHRAWELNVDSDGNAELNISDEMTHFVISKLQKSLRLTNLAVAIGLINQAFAGSSKVLTRFGKELKKHFGDEYAYQTYAVVPEGAKSRSEYIYFMIETNLTASKTVRVCHPVFPTAVTDEEDKQFRENILANPLDAIKVGPFVDNIIGGLDHQDIADIVNVNREMYINEEV